MSIETIENSVVTDVPNGETAGENLAESVQQLSEGVAELAEAAQRLDSLLREK